MKTLEYKKYIGSIEASIDDNILHGKLLHIRDLVTYEAETVAGLKTAFCEAVDEYLSDCHSAGKAPDAPFKGVFNVRIEPDLHRALVGRAHVLGCSLNEYVANALSRHDSSFLPVSEGGAAHLVFGRWFTHNQPAIGAHVGRDYWGNNLHYVKLVEKAVGGARTTHVGGRDSVKSTILTYKKQTHKTASGVQ